MKYTTKITNNIVYFTVCKSRLKIIRATNPERIPRGDRLMMASIFPKKSPETLSFYNGYYE